MSPQEFEEKYAGEAGITVEQLRARGRIVVPCEFGHSCPVPGCTGWNSIPGDLLDDYKMMGKTPRDWTWPQ